MPGLVLRVLVLLLAVLFQAGGWSSGACSSASSATDREKSARLEPASLAADNDAGDNRVKNRGAANGGAGGWDALEDSSEELSAVDDSSGGDVLPASVPNWCSPLGGGRGYAWVRGLAPGGPPADTPFKPPRA